MDSSGAPTFSVKQPGLGPRRGPRADPLPGQADVHTAGAQRLIQAAAFEFVGLRRQLDRKVVDHHRERLAVGAAQPLDGDDLVAAGEVQLGGDLVVGLADLIVEQLRRRLLACPGQVVEQAGQLDATVHRILHDLRADPALADQQALVDDLLDGPSRRRPRQREPLGQGEFVLEPIARERGDRPRMAASIAWASW